MEREKDGKGKRWQGQKMEREKDGKPSLPSPLPSLFFRRRKKKSTEEKAKGKARKKGKEGKRKKKERKPKGKRNEKRRKRERGKGKRGKEENSTPSHLNSLSTVCCPTVELRFSSELELPTLNSNFQSLRVEKLKSWAGQTQSWTGPTFQLSSFFNSKALTCSSETKARKHSQLHEKSGNFWVSKLASSELLCALFCITPFRHSDSGSHLLI